jgi:hypothetical protein
MKAGADPNEPRLCDFDESVLRRSVVVVLDCDMAIVNDPNEFMLADKPPRNGDGVGFLPKVRICQHSCVFLQVMVVQL